MVNPVPPHQSASQWVKCISLQDNIRGVAIQSTQLIQEMATRHQLRGEGARGLGEAVVAALMLSSFCKKGQKVNLNIQGQGLYQQGLVDAHPDGTVRGYVIEREIVFQDSNFGPWGSGLLSVLRTKEEEGNQPYIGTVPLLTGHLAKDLSYYWVQSEQIPTAVGIAVSMDSEQPDKVVSAGGFLVQALPGASEKVVQTIEQHIFEISSLETMLTKDGDPLHLLSQIFQNNSFSVIEEMPLAFKCSCSWDRVERALRLLGKVELRAMQVQKPPAVVHCDFCAKDYDISLELLTQLIQQLG
ncbi:MAG: Hsp33 family molecular chaperone HslO [Bdellovibrionia bacterium]